MSKWNYKNLKCHNRYLKMNDQDQKFVFFWVIAGYLKSIFLGKNLPY